jgi:Ca-activated chloride channel family protein
VKTWLGIDLFANPEALLLLLLIPLYLFWYLRFYRQQRLVIRMSYDPIDLGQSRANLTFLRWLPRGLQLLALALLIVAIARPQTADEVVQRKAEGIDIMLTLDVSGSMETDDFSPDRLSVAKRTAASFIEGRNSDQMGLVLFAQYALTYAPLTLDHEYLARMIAGVDFGLLPRSGTAIGSAVAMSLNRLGESDNPSQVILLLTDGANNRGDIDPITAAKLAAERRVRIYSIGIGQPLYQLASQLDSTDAVASSPSQDLDEETLQRMADLTGGRFFRATDPRRLQEIFTEIASLETGEVEDLSYRIVQDRYPIFVKIAIILLGVSFLLMLTFMYNPLEQ